MSQTVVSVKSYTQGGMHGLVYTSCTIAQFAAALECKMFLAVGKMSGHDIGCMSCQSLVYLTCWLQKRRWILYWVALMIQYKGRDNGFNEAETIDKYRVK